MTEKLRVIAIPQIHMNKEILRLAIPNIISNLSIPLLSFVDIALILQRDNFKLDNHHQI
ncbi:MAG: hypothetical protein ACUZ8E_05420 [Candidatus Anammoxibacter sp.]